MCEGEHVRKQDKQKRWYDVKTRLREFKAGDSVLVLLPTSTSKVLAQWQGPYQVLERMGHVTYLVNMFDKKKRRRVFHVNMLKTFSVRTAPEVCSYAEEDVDQDDISVWKEASTKKADFGDQLSGQERGRLDKLLECYQTVFSDTPGLTRLAENRIPTVENNAVRLPPYRLPHAYRVLVRKELPTIYTLLLLYRSPIDRLDEEVDPEHRSMGKRMSRCIRKVERTQSLC